MTTKPQDPRPETIRLPDGREFSVKELISKTTRPRGYNLITQRMIKPGRVPKALRDPRAQVKALKYTLDERIWQATSTIEELQEKYGIDHKQAQQMQYQSRYIMAQLDLTDKLK